VEEVVRSGRLARNGLVRRHRQIDRHAVMAAIDTVGLTERARTPMSELSGGLQRRVLVARALAGNADVLVLDEPFAGVDYDSQWTLAATFRALAERQVTLIVVLHELGLLDDVVTRAVHLASGEVAYDGPPADRPAALQAHDHTADPHCATDRPDAHRLFSR
jgi:zinc transport system ATP-binding protein